MNDIHHLFSLIACAGAETIWKALEEQTDTVDLEARHQHQAKTPTKDPMNFFKRFFGSRPKPAPPPARPFTPEVTKALDALADGLRAKQAKWDSDEDQYYEKLKAKLLAERESQASPKGAMLPAYPPQVPAEQSEPSKAPPPVATKIAVPKPSRIYVAGNMFSPDKDDLIFGVRGFFHRHDNLERDLPPGVEIEGLFAMGFDVAQFCEVALSGIFDDGKHPGAYYLDAVLLAPNGKQMMVVMLWEGDQTSVARRQIPGGAQR